MSNPEPHEDDEFNGSVCVTCNGTAEIECGNCFGSCTDDDGEPCAECGETGFVDCPMCVD